jgi:glycosyltransferase involved in cell wall biosynthesis
MATISITFIITDLRSGGAEMMLYRLLGGLDKQRFSSRVIALSGGPLGEKIEQLGIEVRCLGMKPGFPDPFALLRLKSWLGKQRPQLVQTWMYHADLMGGLAARFAGAGTLVWGIRNNTLDARLLKRSTRLTARACARLSAIVPDRIVVNSRSAMQVHTAFGYRDSKMELIPNGFDTQAFRPDKEARREVRQELGVKQNTPLIGFFARFDPMKDHPNFIQAAGLLHAAMPQVHFLLCGGGISIENRDFTGWIESTSAKENFHLLGERQDVPRLTAALDLATTASSSEAFPNVIGEAMACEVPCVVTDVGDSHILVGNTGKVVPPHNPGALASAWGDILQMPPERRRVMGATARRRIEEQYSLTTMVGRFEKLYLGLVTEKGA